MAVDSDASSAVFCWGVGVTSGRAWTGIASEDAGVGGRAGEACRLELLVEDIGAGGCGEAERAGEVEAAPVAATL